MSLLDVGTKCAACGVVDFLPFSCSGCSGVFCREHVQEHPCSGQPTATATDSARKRIRGTCAARGCTTETIESIGGYEGSYTDGGGEGIARSVRCVCGGAFCVTHRDQSAHDCPEPYTLSERADAAEERRARAQGVLARTMPAHAGKARVKMPEQVDRTRAPVKSAALPPSVLAAMEKEKEKEEETQVGEPAQKSTPEFAPPPAAPQPSAPSWTDSPAYAKLYKVHCIKLRSLAKSLDGCAPRDQSRAVEWTAGPADRVRAWASDNFKPEAVAPAVGERAPARIWVPETMPAGKLFDTLVAAAKLPASELTLVRVPIHPGRAPPAALDLSRPAPLEHGDVLVLARGW